MSASKCRSDTLEESKRELYGSFHRIGPGKAPSVRSPPDFHRFSGCRGSTINYLIRSVAERDADAPSRRAPAAATTLTDALLQVLYGWLSLENPVRLE